MNLYKNNSNKLRHIVYTKHITNYSEILIRTLNTCIEMINEIVEHKELRTFTSEEFKHDISLAHLFHGERERFIRQWPESNNEPGDIIAKFRPNDNLKIAQVRRMAFSLIAASYKESLNNIIIKMKEEYTQQQNSTYMNLYPFSYIEYEREIVLMTKICTFKWFNYEEVKNADKIKNVFIIEEMSNTAFDQIDYVILNYNNKNSSTTTSSSSSIPILLKLVQIYYIIDTKSTTLSIYSTHFFIEAYMIWLSLLVNYDIISENKIHRKILPILKMFMKFIF
jgi:hypothetical protein